METFATLFVKLDISALDDDDDVVEVPLKLPDVPMLDISDDEEQISSALLSSDDPELHALLNPKSPAKTSMPSRSSSSSATVLKRPAAVHVIDVDDDEATRSQCIILRRTLQALKMIRENK